MPKRFYGIEVSRKSPYTTRQLLLTFAGQLRVLKGKKCSPSRGVKKTKLLLIKAKANPKNLLEVEEESQRSVSKGLNLAIYGLENMRLKIEPSIEP